MPAPTFLLLEYFEHYYCLRPFITIEGEKIYINIETLKPVRNQRHKRTKAVDCLAVYTLLRSHFDI